MKSSIKYLTFIALFSVLSFTAEAQRGGGDRTPPNPAEKAEKQTTKMVEDLNLNQTQANRVRTINLNAAHQMHAAHERNGDDREAMKAAKTAIKNTREAELSQVLTTAQFAKYEEMNANRKKGNKDSLGLER